MSERIRRCLHAWQDGAGEVPPNNHLAGDTRPCLPDGAGLDEMSLPGWSDYVAALERFSLALSRPAA